MAQSQRLFIVGAKRTPFGAYGGKLKNLNATDLAVRATSAALEAAKVDPAAVGSVCAGNVMQTAPDAAYMARHVRSFPRC